MTCIGEHTSERMRFMIYGVVRMRQQQQQAEHAVRMCMRHGDMANLLHLRLTRSSE